MSDRTYFLNNYVNVDGLLQNLHPMSKLACLFLFAIAIMLSQKYFLLVFVFDVIFYFFLFIFSGIKPGIILRQYLFAFLIFSVFFLFNFFFTGNNRGSTYHLLFLVYLINFYLLINLFIWTTDIGVLAGYLDRSGFPGTIVTLVLLMYRIVFILLSEVSLLATIINLRLKRQKLGVFNKFKIIFTNLFERSFTRIERFTVGALTRGFNGRFMTLSRFSWKIKDTLALIILILICTIKVYLNYV